MEFSITEMAFPHLMQPLATEGMYLRTPRTSPGAPRWDTIFVAESFAEAFGGTKGRARNETQAISRGILRRGGDVRVRRAGGRGGRQYPDQSSEGARRGRVSLHPQQHRRLPPYRQRN